MDNLKSIPLNFVLPNHCDFNTFKDSCLLIPINTNYNFSTYNKKSAKSWKEDFENFLLLANKKAFPNKKKKENLLDVNNNSNNLFHLIRQNVTGYAPCICLAYHTANCWIIVFLTIFFEKNKNILHSPEIIDCEFDPVLYSYKNFKN